MYGIKVHCYFPGTIYSPGFDEEEKCKPAITKKIEGTDEGLTPDGCARVLFRG
jgi:3-dehydrosphinganine reductase